MFTMQDLDAVMPEVRGTRKKNVFHPSKNPLTYRLSKMGSQERGSATELLVRERLRSMGKKIVYFGGKHSFDMLADNQKIEVKSSLAVPKIVRGRKVYHYQFRHICPSKFHKLVMVFVSPEKMEVRIMDSRTVAKYLGGKDRYRDLCVTKKILGKVLAA
jgi:hypothetical protein